MRPSNINRLGMPWFVALSFAFGISVARGEQPPSPIQVAETTRPAEATSSPDTSPPDTDWTQHGNEWREQRYSPLEQVNRENVSRLGLAWSFDMLTNRGVEATPLVIGGVMYVSGSWSIVYALDARTGALKWLYDPEVDRSFLAKGCCDAVNRGVAFKDGRVFVGTYDGRLVALNAADGRVLWDVQTTDRNQSYTITGAPRIAGDLVVIGNGGADMGVRGYVTAYEAATGKPAWRFYTVPGNPADGFESDAMKMAAKTWNGEWWKWGGGGTVWDSIVYDPELDFVYIGVGNGAPRNQELRSPGGGDNLFLASIVALRAKTGEYVWHYQTTPGETWDYTATQPMMLAELEIGGGPRKVLMQAPKNGFFYVLDRTNGKLISAREYTKINWATGIDLATGRPIQDPQLRDFKKGVTVLPFIGGGHNWSPMSYNPKTGLVYFAEMSVPQTLAAPTRDIDRLPDMGMFNGGFDSLAAAPPPLPDLDEYIASVSSGRLLGWDPVRQEARWVYPQGRPSNNGTLSTAGMLVFQGDPFGKVRAFDAESGKPLWSFDAQTQAMAGPVSYALDGQQYIAFAVGVGGGVSHEAGALSHAWKQRNVSRVLAFRLGGTAQLPPLPPDERVMPKPQPVTAGQEVVAHGQVMYQRYCSYCHGDALRTGALNPDLRWSSADVHAVWQDIVIGGMLQPAGMVSFKKYLTPEDAEAIRQYVLSEANRLYAQSAAATAGAAK